MSDVQQSKYRKTVDWELMRPDWIAGIKSVLQLSREYDVSRAAIIKHWGELKVERDLTARIKARADALVTKSLVTTQVTDEATVTQIIEINALNNAQIQIAERQDVSRARSLSMSLLVELEHQTHNKDLYSDLGEILGSDESEGRTNKLNEIYKRVTSFGGRIDGVKKLSETLKTLIELERKVYKIDDTDSGTETFEDFLRRIRGV